jgi:uncharacterized lipoprotein YajG
VASGAAVQPAAASVSKNTTIVLSRFADERTDKSVVGTVRNGFGMRTADVVATKDVSEWVTSAVGSELRANGYKVVSGADQDLKDPKLVVLSGSVQNAFCDMYMSYSGQVSLLAKVTSGNSEVINRQYTGEGSAGVVMAATGESFAESLSLALRDALKQFMADLEGKLADK